MAVEGNQFWKMRSIHGRSPKFETPEQLWNAACEYFQWVNDNPLKEDKVNFHQGVAVHEPVTKMRAMTIRAMCFFIGLSRQGWFEYSKKPDFSDIVQEIEDVIYSQKFEGASADLLNANIIARELGLADKQEFSGFNGKPIVTASLPPEEAYKLMLEK